VTVRHLLLDADGVVQRVGGEGWRARVTGYLGDRADDFVARLGELEDPALTGGGDFPAGLGRALAEHGVDVDPEAVYAGVWLDVEILPGTLGVVESVRRTGIGVHLATNQHPRRADHMKEHLGYDVLFDRSFYSCDLGVAKPDPGFFTRVAALLDSPVPELLFVDDSHDNVVGARVAGLAAEHWHHDHGVPALAALLAAHGISVDGTGTP